MNLNIDDTGLQLMVDGRPHRLFLGETEEGTQVLVLVHAIFEAHEEMTRAVREQQQHQRVEPQKQEQAKQDQVVNNEAAEPASPKAREPVQQEIPQAQPAPQRRPHR